MVNVVRNISEVFESPNGEIVFAARGIKVSRNFNPFEFQFDIGVPQRAQWRWYDFVQPIVYCRLSQKTRMFWDWLRCEIEHKYLPIEAVICQMMTSAESAYWSEMVKLRLILLPSEYGAITGG